MDPSADSSSNPGRPVPECSSDLTHDRPGPPAGTLRGQCVRSPDPPLELGAGHHIASGLPRVVVRGCVRRGRSGRSFPGSLGATRRHGKRGAQPAQLPHATGTGKRASASAPPAQRASAPAGREILVAVAVAANAVPARRALESSEPTVAGLCDAVITSADGHVQPHGPRQALTRTRRRTGRHHRRDGDAHRGQQRQVTE